MINSTKIKAEDGVIRGEEGEHGDGGGEEERSDEEEAEASSPFGAEAGGNGDEDARRLERKKMSPG